jgi:hypothetical protein
VNVDVTKAWRFGRTSSRVALDNSIDNSPCLLILWKGVSKLKRTEEGNIQVFTAITKMKERRRKKDGRDGLNLNPWMSKSLLHR